MKIVGAVFADFVDGSLGLAASLDADLAGTPVIVRTLRSLALVEGLAARCIVVRERDASAARACVQAAGLEGGIDVAVLDDGVRPRRALIQAARKWSIDSWRGGLLGTTWFDEFVAPRVIAAVLDHYGAEGVLCIEGHQAVLDPRIATRMCARANEQPEATPHVFTQAPPGLAGLLLRREVVRDLLEMDVPFGLFLSYRPELAQPDPITRPACVNLDTGITETRARFCADTAISRAMLAAALREHGEDVDAATLCAFARRTELSRAADLPVEVELELTTADSLPRTTLRPRGGRVPQRELSDVDAVRRIAAELGALDDRLVMLGGHGDPLLHPELPAVCEALREAGVYGLAVTTNLIDFSEAAWGALTEVPVDVVEVRIDAVSAGQYERVHGADRFAEVVANVERLERWRREQSAARPIVVPTLTRCAATLAEMEAFYDTWIQRVGSAVLRGYSDFGAQLPAETLLPTVPPTREGCRRLAGRLMLLADGAAVACDQDLRGELRLGDWRNEPLRAIWSGTSSTALRERHASAAWTNLPVCGPCKEWFRP